MPPSAASCSIALDGVVAGHGGGECAGGVFDHACCGIVQAAMGDRHLREPGQGLAAPPSRGMEHEPYSTSNMPSTSTATLRGNDPEPTAERACLPFSPRTSTRRSEAPLTTLGWSAKSATAFTKPTILTHRSHPVEIAAAGLAHLGEDVDGAQPRRLGGFLDAEILADLALVFDLAVLQR